MKRILLVNPWIYDFAAYDLWIKPWGLLKISSILKKNGFEVFFIDTLDRHSDLATKPAADHQNGTGKFHSEQINKPEALKNIPRKYKRYGISVNSFKQALPDTDVDLVFITSGMTYWYPAVFDSIKIIKEKYGSVPVVLGGTYATLCYEHACKNSGADKVIKNKELSVLSGVLEKRCDFSFQEILNETIDYAWYKKASYGVLRLSLGCPFFCTYCAQDQLGPGFMVKPLDKALSEIKFLIDRGIRKFAFYDDALLFDNRYIEEYLKAVISMKKSLEFYTPNGVHAKFITKNIAKLLKQANFKNPILSLETSSDEMGHRWHKKVTKSDLTEAVNNLTGAGFNKGEYTVYLLLGVPDSRIADVKESVDFVYSQGARISLSEFSPIPGTSMSAGYGKPLEEPLLQNNSIFPSFSRPEWTEIQHLKDYVRQLNNSYNLPK